MKSAFIHLWLKIGELPAPAVKFAEGNKVNKVWGWPVVLRVFKERLVFRRISGDRPVMEIVFDVTQEGDGGYVAECLSHDIFTQGNTWEELRANVREAVSAYFFDQPKPAAVRLHLVRDELLAGA